MCDVYVGRQPIYDRHLHAVAYELHFRSGNVSHAQVTDPDVATAQVLLTTSVEIAWRTW